jgi:hypothetical protein
MFNFSINNYKQKVWGHRPGTAPGRPACPENLSTEQVAELMLKRPELRLTDNPANIQLAQLLMATAEDQHIQELFQLIARDGLGKAIVAEDEFLGNYPPKGGISYPSDFLSLGTMPTGDLAGIIINQLTGNVLLIGRTKSAKTSLLAVLLSYPQLLQTVRIVVFAKKRELRDLATIPQLRDLVITFKLEELILCYFQPPDGVPETAWNNESTKIFGQCYARYSAQRLMGDKVNELMANHPEGIYPTIRQLVEVLDRFRPRFGMREAAYKESILWCLQDLLNCTCRIWDYSNSDFLEHLYCRPGLSIIEAEALPQEHLTFIAVYLMRWLYLKRVYSGWNNQ